jgi:septum site-determining protein MinD
VPSSFVDPEHGEGRKLPEQEDVQGILSFDLIGVIPESPSVLNASNAGLPVVLDRESNAGQAYNAMVAR